MEKDNGVVDAASPKTRTPIFLQDPSSGVAQALVTHLSNVKWQAFIITALCPFCHISSLINYLCNYIVDCEPMMFGANLLNRFDLH